MDLIAPVTAIPGIGTAIEKKLGKLGVSTVFDLLYHLPFRYEDRTRVAPISSLRPEDLVTVKGSVAEIKNEFTRKGRFLQVAKIQDQTGILTVIWFNQPYLTRALKAGDEVALYGKVDFYKNSLALISPDYELPRGELLHMARIVPVYPETAGISSKWLRTKIHFLLQNLVTSEILPPDSGLMSWKEALLTVHFPSSFDQIQSAKSRLAFDELFLLQLTSQIRKQIWHRTKLAHAFEIDQQKVLDFIASLPFSLTLAQNNSVRQILNDLTSVHPMNRLLEGDVGSGKTVVAAIGALVAYLNGFQTLLMAPTQILASQHFQTLTALFKPLGVEIGLITSSSKLNIVNSKLKIIVGTHALLSDKNQALFNNVGLVVIDEQHRFGVTQRALAANLGQTPHILTMTATPIPRTVALTMYGDLDLSVLDTKPIGRLPVKTWLVPEAKREASYKWIEKQLTGLPAGRQGIWVCPFINDSESMTSVKAASAEFDHLREIFPKLKLGLLHGKLKAGEKDIVMEKFRNAEIDILVATPIVEVGLDIPNAALMIIEGAERFGLAQLHQLRGRVGRSSDQSYCLLFTSTDTDSVRIKNMEKFNSGIELAEADLELRGPGDVYGTTQHGFPQFKVAVYSDLHLLDQAKALAAKTLPHLESYPLLRQLIKEDKIHLIEPN